MGNGHLSPPRDGKLRHGCKCCTGSLPHLKAHKDVEERWPKAPRAPSRSHFAPRAVLTITGAAHRTLDPFSDPFSKHGGGGTRRTSGAHPAPPGSPPPWGTSLPGAPSHDHVARTDEELRKSQLGKKTRGQRTEHNFRVQLSRSGGKKRGFCRVFPFLKGT